MNHLRMFAGLACAILLNGGVCAFSQSVVTLDEIFLSAETNSARLRPLITAQSEDQKEIDIAKNKRLPEIDAKMSLSYIGNGFTTERNFSDYQRAPIPHFGSGVSVEVNQPIYAGGAINNSIEMARLKSSATRFATDLSRNNLRFELTGYYLDLYKYINLRAVIESNRSSAQKILA